MRGRGHTRSPPGAVRLGPPKASKRRMRSANWPCRSPNTFTGARKRINEACAASASCAASHSASSTHVDTTNGESSAGGVQPLRPKGRRKGVRHERRDTSTRRDRWARNIAVRCDAACADRALAVVEVQGRATAARWSSAAAMCAPMKEGAALRATRVHSV